jgi:hypothetical protein
MLRNKKKIFSWSNNFLISEKILTFIVIVQGLRTMVRNHLFSDHNDHLPELGDLKVIWKILEYRWIQSKYTLPLFFKTFRELKNIFVFHWNIFSYKGKNLLTLRIEGGNEKYYKLKEKYL